MCQLEQSAEALDEILTAPPPPPPPKSPARKRNRAKPKKLRQQVAAGKVSRRISLSDEPQVALAGR